MTHYPNKDDYTDNFWNHNYKILVSAQGIEFIVNANCAGDAIDYVIDMCVKEFPGLVMSREEQENEEFLEDYISGGNEGRYLNTMHVRIERL